MWRARDSNAEADPAGLGLAELDVGQGTGRDEDLTTLVISKSDGLGLGIGHGGQHLSWESEVSRESSRLACLIPIVTCMGLLRIVCVPY